MDEFSEVFGEDADAPLLTLVDNRLGGRLPLRLLGANLAEIDLIVFEEMIAANWGLDHKEKIYKSKQKIFYS